LIRKLPALLAYACLVAFRSSFTAGLLLVSLAKLRRR